MLQRFAPYPLIALAIVAATPAFAKGGAPAIRACPAVFRGIVARPSFQCSCSAEATQQGTVVGGEGGNFSPDSSVCRTALFMNAVDAGGGTVNNIQDVKEAMPAFRAGQGFNGVNAVDGPGARVYYRLGY